MKITGFEIHKVSVRWRDLMFVEVHTDAGLTGLGEATLESRTDIAESVLRWLLQDRCWLTTQGQSSQRTCCAQPIRLLGQRKGLRLKLGPFLTWQLLTGLAR